MRRTRTAWCDEPDPFCPPLTVYEAAPEGPVDTGLLDARGTKIFRRQSPTRMGFDLTPRPVGKKRMRS